jgi:hypothetical protein
MTTSCLPSSTEPAIFFPAPSIVKTAELYTTSLPGQDPYRYLSFSPVEIRDDPYTLSTIDEKGAYCLTLSVTAVFLENLLHIRDDIITTYPFYLSGYTKMGLTALLGVITTIVIALSAIAEIITRIGLAILLSPFLLLPLCTKSDCSDCFIWLAKSALYNVFVIPIGAVAAHAMFTKTENFKNAKEITALLHWMKI